MSDDNKYTSDAEEFLSELAPDGTNRIRIAIRVLSTGRRVSLVLPLEMSLTEALEVREFLDEYEPQVLPDVLN